MVSFNALFQSLERLLGQDGVHHTNEHKDVIEDTNQLVDFPTTNNVKLVLKSSSFEHVCHWLVAQMCTGLLGLGFLWFCTEYQVKHLLDVTGLVCSGIWITLASKGLLVENARFETVEDQIKEENKPCKMDVIRYRTMDIHESEQVLIEESKRATRKFVSLVCFGLAILGQISAFPLWYSYSDDMHLTMLLLIILYLIILYNVIRYFCLMEECRMMKY